MSGASGSLQGSNLYVYCFNNPVNMTDQAGSWPSWNNIKTGLVDIGNWVHNSIITPIVGFGADIAEDCRNPHKQIAEVRRKMERSKRGTKHKNERKRPSFHKNMPRW